MRAISQPSNIEQAFTQALSRLSPSDIIQSTVLRTCFNDFLNRGSPEDCWELVPQVHQDAISTKYGFSTAPSNAPSSPNFESVQKASHAGSATLNKSRMSTGPSNPPASNPSRGESRAGKQQGVPVLPSPESSEGPQSPGSRENPKGLKTPLEYFKTKCNSSARQARLVRVTRDILEACALPESSYNKLWSTRGDLFNGPKSESKFCRLQRGRKELAKRSSEYNCARPLSLLFLAHEVDYCALTYNFLNLGRGRSRKTCAFKQLAESSGISLQCLKDDYWRSVNYFTLLQEMGPGILLRLGSEVESNWEIKINKEDVSWVVEYLKTYHIELHKSPLDAIAARCIIIGLMAYGWTSSELLQSESPLIKAVKSFVDIHKLSVQKSPKRRRGGDDGDVKHSKRRRTACSTHSEVSNIVGNGTVEVQRPRGCSLSAMESNSSSKATLFSGSERSAIAESPADLRVGSEPSAGTPTAHQELTTPAVDEGEPNPNPNAKNKNRTAQISESPGHQSKRASITNEDETPGGNPNPMRAAITEATDSSQGEQEQPIGTSSAMVELTATPSALEDSRHLELQLSPEEYVSDHYVSDRRYDPIVAASSQGPDVPIFRRISGQPAFRRGGGDWMISGRDEPKS